MPRRQRLPRLHFQHQGRLVLHEIRLRRACRRHRRHRRPRGADRRSYPDARAAPPRRTRLPAARADRRSALAHRGPEAPLFHRRRELQRQAARRLRSPTRPGNSTTRREASARRSPSPTRTSARGSTSPSRRSRANPENYSDREAAWADATAGAINAFLRAETVDDRAESLSLLGDALARRENWKRRDPRLPRQPRDQRCRSGSARPTTRSSPSTASASSRTRSMPIPPTRNLRRLLRPPAGVAAGPRRLRHRRGRRRPRDRAAAAADLHRRRQAWRPLHRPPPRRPAGRRTARRCPPGRAQHLCARPRALGRLCRQRLRPARRRRRLDPALLGQHRQAPRPRSTASATAALPKRSATGSFLSQLSSYQRRRHREQPAARRSGKARSASQSELNQTHDHGHPDRRRAQRHEARRLCHHRAAPTAGTATNGARSPRNGSSSPTSA